MRPERPAPVPQPTPLTWRQGPLPGPCPSVLSVSCPSFWSQGWNPDLKPCHQATPQVPILRHFIATWQKLKRKDSANRQCPPSCPVMLLELASVTHRGHSRAGTRDTVVPVGDKGVTDRPWAGDRPLGDPCLPLGSVLQRDGCRRWKETGAGVFHPRLGGNVTSVTHTLARLC